MVYKLLLSEHAESDIIHAAQWYEQQKAGLGSEFLTAIDKAFAAVQLNPKAYRIRKKTVRGCVVVRFPYLILYFIKSDKIHIVSVFHTHRKPKPNMFG